MGSLTEDEILEIISVFPFDIKVAVETGTYKGQTTRSLAKHIEKVHTIEVYGPMYAEAQVNNSDLDNIVYHLGDTLHLLGKIVAEIKEPALYFIDAHFSGDDSYWNECDKCPLLKEIELILENTRTRQLVFVFDDYRLFGSQAEYYPEWKGVTEETICATIEKLKFRVSEAYVKNDKYHVFIVD